MASSNGDDKNSNGDHQRQKVVVIYSGGMDSFTLLHQYHQRQDIDVYALTFDYGQRHDKEIAYAKRVCTTLGIAHKVIDISVIHSLLDAGGACSLLAPSADNNNQVDDIPEGHYASDNMKSTVVPNRNMILLSLAVGYAVSLGANQVIYGAHSGDHASKSLRWFGFRHKRGVVWFFQQQSDSLALPLF